MEVFAHRAVELRREGSRIWVEISCPFCGAVATTTTVSLAGAGKRCPCGAKHLPAGTLRGSSALEPTAAAAVMEDMSPAERMVRELRSQPRDAQWLIKEFGCDWMTVLKLATTRIEWAMGISRADQARIHTSEPCADPKRCSLDSHYRRWGPRRLFYFVDGTNERMAAMLEDLCCDGHC